MIRLRFSAILLTLLGLCSASRAQEQETIQAVAPYEMARTLQTIQSQVANGNAAAVTAQRTLLDAMGTRFLAADPKVWEDGRNARAAVSYTLSGGNPNVLKQLLTLNPPIAVDANLAKGAVAYVEDRQDEARELLMPLDARALPVSLGGHVALIQAGLIAREDLKRASALLDDARLLMPGTLVEEAALRRQVFIVAQIGDLDRFEFLSQQYLRRFGNSIYATDFRQRFATAITRLSIADSDARFHRLEGMLKSTDTQSQRALFLQVARSAVIHGKLETARIAARDALEVAPLGSSDSMRAKLYEASSGITTENFEEYQRDLDGINRRQIGRRDNDLLDAAQSVAAAIREETPEPEPLESVSQVLTDPARSNAWVLDVMRRAEAGVEASQKLLKEAPVR